MKDSKSSQDRLINDQNQEVLLSEISRISDELISNSHADGPGICWETQYVDYDSDRKIAWRKTDSIYNGVSGILLFFLDLFRYAGDKKHLNILDNGARWLTDFIKKEPDFSPAFFTGRTGSMYFLAEYHKLTGDEKSMQVIDDYLVILKTKIMRGKRDDLLNGRAGVILGLLHLYNLTQRYACLELIDSLLKSILQGTRFGSKGLYWDHSPQNVNGLCGFSHGAAGMGYVFFELYHFFSNPAFKWLALQSLEYENFHYEALTNNWPDFRGSSFFDSRSIKHKAPLTSEGILDYTNNPRNLDIAAWCHGAPGIGMSRLRAYELTSDPGFLEDMNKASEKTVRSVFNRPGMSPNLCHGLCGNAFFLLERYKLTGETMYLQHCEQVAIRLIDRKKNGEMYKPGHSTADAEDTSLFLGNAGVGYFLLHVLNPALHSTFSLLKPDIRSKNHADVSGLQYISCDQEFLKDILVKKDRPLAYAMLTRNNIKPADFFDNGLSFDTKRLASVKDLSPKENRLICLENDTSIEQRSMHNYAAYCALESEVAQKNSELAKITDTGLLERSLVLSGLVKLRGESQPGKDNYDHLFYLSGDGAKVFELSQFSGLVLEQFKSPQIVSNAFYKMKDRVNIETISERDLRHTFLLQIRNALRAGILTA